MTTTFLILIALMVLCLLVLMRIQYVRREDYSAMNYVSKEEDQAWERINRRYDAAIWFVWLFCMVSIAVLIYLNVS